MKHSYKQLTLAQLRSFCEVVRCGSLSAAARAMDLSHPTIWKQVHSLEAQLGTPLIETHRRGCQPTAAGRALLELALPLLEGLGSIEAGFRANYEDRHVTLRLAASPRTLAEELLGFLEVFARDEPAVRVIAHEIPDVSIFQLLADRRLDIGLNTPGAGGVLPAGLVSEPVYDLEPVLLVPHDHPFTKKRFKLADLAGEPLLNNLDRFPSAAIAARLRELGAHEHPARRFELTGADTIRRYVRRGCGVGVIGRVAAREDAGDVREISLARWLGPLPVHAVYRASALRQDAREKFLGSLRRYVQALQTG